MSNGGNCGHSRSRHYGMLSHLTIEEGIKSPVYPPVYFVHTNKTLFWPDNPPGSVLVLDSYDTGENCFLISTPLTVVFDI